MRLDQKLTLSAALFALAVPVATEGAPGLLVGWETWTESGADTWNATLLNGMSGQGKGTPESGGSWFNFSNATVANGASSDGTFGTFAGAVADNTTNASNDATALSNGYDGFIDFTVTNTSLDAIELSAFHFDAGAFRPNAANEWGLSVQSGAVTNGSVESSTGPVTTAAAPIVDDYDIDLTGLADRTVGVGESVVFRLNWTGGTAPPASGGHHTFLDNVGISGTVIPEPTSLALLGLGSLLVARRRR
ncbi:MAG: PEP-CTERM sorting domain-containing protein [Planctomycetota bacterium]